MSAPQFNALTVHKIAQEAGAVALTFAVPAELRDAYSFKPGQFLTLRAQVNGEILRRSYSICSSAQRYTHQHEIEVGIKPVAQGQFSNWATLRQVGEKIDVMTPEGRFSPCEFDAKSPETHANHRVAIVAGSGITPVLSIIASVLTADPKSCFTLIYGNQRVASIMFNEALQDLKDQFPARLSLMHVLSRQAQETPVLSGRIDADKLPQLIALMPPLDQISEFFICGPEGMIDASEAALLLAGVAKDRIHTERFFVADSPKRLSPALNSVDALSKTNTPVSAATRLQVVLDGKTHTLEMGAQDKLLDVALGAGLDLPYACRGGVCCTCRARVLSGQVEMEKNFTLEKWEVDKGFVLTCQARALTAEVTVSFDER